MGILLISVSFLTEAVAGERIEPSAPVAQLDGKAMTLAGFVRFLDAARHAGYRPATDAEALRLLRAYLRERILVRETLRRGLELNEAGRRATLRALVARFAESARVSDDRVRAYLVASARARGEPPGEPFSSEEIATARRVLRKRGESVQRTALLERLLESAQVEVDHGVLNRLVTGSGDPTRPPTAPAREGPRP
ncbi:MAG: hypothetical protein ACE5EV_05695 [Gaiellales bacterium]